MKSFKTYLAEDAKRTLYVNRPLLNGADVVLWAKKHGCETCLKPDQMHVTLCYSKTPMDWPESLGDQVIVPQGPKEVKKFDGGALVLKFVHPTFTKRAAQLESLGASSDFPDYQAHITLTYKSDGIEAGGFAPYEGILLFGPEVFVEIDGSKSWKNEHLEEQMNA